MSSHATQRASQKLQHLLRLLSVVLAAAALLWPAFLNGLPLLFPDTLLYLGLSHAIFDKLRGQQIPASALQCFRSEIYTATLRPLHHRGDLWAIVILQSILTAWIVWLVVRTLFPSRPIRIFLFTMLPLAGISGLAWYTSFVMPDLFGATLYLSLFLLVLQSRSLRRWEFILLSAFAVWAITAHSSHLLVTSVLCLLFLLLRLLKFPGLQTRGILLAFGILLSAVLAQVLVHARVDGRPSLFGDAPPFLTARMLNDGPARLFLASHCASLRWTLCAVRNQIPPDAEDILWNPRGLWYNSSPAQRDALRHEQTLLLIGTLREYPGPQLRIFVRDSGRTLINIGPGDFWNIRSVFTPGNLEFATPTLSQRFSRTLQYRDALPQDFFRRVQLPFTILCTLLAAALLPRTFRARRFDLLGLTLVVVVAVLTNAVVCGVLSGVYDRYGGRISWLLVFLASLLLANALPRRDRAPIRLDTHRNEYAERP